MITALLRLFALRPFLTMVIMGVPVLILIAIGLLTIAVFKLLIFVVLPIAIVVWLIRRLGRTESQSSAV